MTTSSLIDAYVQDHLELSLTDPYVATEVRPMVLRAAQKVVGVDLWAFAPWRFKHGSAAVAMVNGTGALPADFKNVGSRGQVILTGQQLPPLKYADAERIIGDRSQASSSVTGNPCYYGLYSTNIEVETYFTGNLTVYYEKIRPTLADSVANPGNGLEGIPVDFHEGILLGVVDYLTIPTGDGRADEISPRFRKFLSDQSADYVDALDGLQQLGDFGISQMRMW